MHFLPAIFSLILGVAGWHYLFNSKAAERLGVVEDEETNARRQRLRRINACIMLLLAVVFPIGFYAIDERSPGTFVASWLAIFILLMLLVVLAVVDLRLTGKLRRRK